MLSVSLLSGFRSSKHGKGSKLTLLLVVLRRLSQHYLPGYSRQQPLGQSLRLHAAALAQQDDLPFARHLYSLASYYSPLPENMIADIVHEFLLYSLQEGSRKWFCKPGASWR
jgi:hypothetical protein